MRCLSRPVVAVVGKSGSGKTTLLEELVRELSRRGYRVGTLKHTSHGFDMDKEGKDSYRLYHAGSVTTAVVGPGEMALVRRIPTDIPVEDLVTTCFTDEDIILVEGFKSSSLPRMEILGPGQKDMLCDISHDGFLALITDNPTESLQKPQFRRDDVESIASFVEAEFLLASKARFSQKETGTDLVKNRQALCS